MLGIQPPQDYMVQLRSLRRLNSDYIASDQGRDVGRYDHFLALQRWRDGEPADVTTATKRAGGTVSK